jgi:hypothetical protein
LPHLDLPRNISILVELFVVVVARSRYCSFSIVIMASWDFTYFYFVGGVVGWGCLFI